MLFNRAWCRQYISIYTYWFGIDRIYLYVIPFCQKNDENGNCSGEGIEFPTTNLYELESRVLTDHWSIPYKREESLGKCLLASTYLARLGKFIPQDTEGDFFFDRRPGFNLSSCCCPSLLS